MKNSNKKTVIKDIKLKDLKKATADYEKEDEELQLVAKIRADPPWQNMPSWLEDYPDTDDVKPSVMPSTACYMMLLKIRTVQRPKMHPVYTVDTLLSENDVKVKSGHLIYKPKPGASPVSIQCTRGYYCLKPETSLTEVAAAHVADTLSYYARADAKGNISPVVTGANATNLLMTKVRCLAARKHMCPEEESETKARDNIFVNCMAKPDVAFDLCNTLVAQNPDFSQISVDATTMYNKILIQRDDGEYDENNPTVISVPFSGQIKLPAFPDNDSIMDLMYGYLLKSRGIRGEDRGVGLLTMGYIMGCMPRAVVKYITFFLDLRQLLTRYDTKVICIVGKIEDMVIRMLVANGYYVVNAFSGVNRILTDKDVEEENFSVYSSIDADVPYGFFHEITSLPPTEKKDKLTYTGVDVVNQLKLSFGQGKVNFHALRCHLHPSMQSDTLEYALLPAALAHNGTVLCAYPKIYTVPANLLAQRAARANFIRNNWVITKKLWFCCDNMRTECGYMGGFVIPKMRRKPKGGQFDYSTLGEGKIDDDLELADIPLGNVAVDPIERVKNDENLIFKGIYNMIFKESVGFNTIVTDLIRNWYSNENFIEVKPWLNLDDKSQDDLLMALRAKIVEDFTEDTVDSYDDAVEEGKRLYDEDQESLGKQLADDGSMQAVNSDVEEELESKPKPKKKIASSSTMEERMAKLNAFTLANLPEEGQVIIK